MGFKEVWFITGASGGFGLHLTKGLLQNGHRVAAVLRDDGDLQDFIGQPTEGWPAADFLPMTVDLTNEDGVRTAIHRTIARFGRIDGVVNYAGCDLSTPVAALSESTIHQYFQENVIGTFHVLKQVMPYLREQGSGMILNYCSAAARAAAAGSMLYTATQLAIKSLSEELTAGIEALGIQQTVVEAAPFLPIGRSWRPTGHNQSGSHAEATRTYDQD